MVKHKLQFRIYFLFHCRSTLHDYVSGKVALGSHTGPQRYLTDEEEAELVKFIVRCSEIGYSKTKSDILSIVQQKCTKQGLQVTVSKGWWESFRHRHPQLTIRAAEGLTVPRVRAFDDVVMGRYYDMLETTLRDNNLWNSPSQIFNCDETGMPLNPGTAKVAAMKGAKHPYQVTGGSKSNITVLACASAAGYALPPMVIFDRKTLRIELTVGEVPGTFYGLSDSGWMDSELFQQWFACHFLKHAPSARPLLLLLDGHSSHYQPEFVKMAAKAQVIIFCLPPHTTHVAQPLDNGPFGALKAHWKEACREYMVQNPYKSVTRYEFCQVFSKAYARAMTIRTITESFRTTGVYPFNRDALTPPKQEGEPNLAKSSGLAYIPMFSPTPRRSDTFHTNVSAYQDQDCTLNDECAEPEDSHKDVVSPTMEYNG